jgi:putative endonuclease
MWDYTHFLHVTPAEAGVYRASLSPNPGFKRLTVMGGKLEVLDGNGSVAEDNTIMANTGQRHKGEKSYYVYMLASRRNGTLYIGITSDLVKRVYEHRNDLVSGFTKPYRAHRLVYYETTADVGSAISREKQLKA